MSTFPHKLRQDTLPSNLTTHELTYRESSLVQARIDLIADGHSPNGARCQSVNDRLQAVRAALKNKAACAAEDAKDAAAALKGGA